MQQLLDRLERIILQLLGGFTGWYSDQEVHDIAGAIADYVAAGQTHAAALTDGYLTNVVEELTGKRSTPAGPPDLNNLRGVDLTTVYERLGKNYRYLRSTGVDDASALKQTIDRANRMASADLNLAKRNQAQRSLEAVKAVTGYRRVLHPELSKSGPCGLCVVAADRIYNKQELMPLHDLCKCEPMAIINGVDPGLALNKQDLDAIYKQAGGTDAPRLKRIRVKVRHHGELGPVLTDANDSFRQLDAA